MNAKWADFDQTFNRLEEIKSFEEWDGERTPSSKCYDSETGSLAYQGLVKQYWEDAFFPKRFRNQEDAELSTKTTKTAFLEYQKEQVAKADYLKNLAKLNQEYKDFLSTLTQYEGRNKYEGSYDMKRHLQEFLSLSESQNFDPRILEELSTHLEKLKALLAKLESEQAAEAELPTLKEKYDIPENIIKTFLAKNLVQFIYNIETLPLEEIKWYIFEHCNKKEIEEYIIHLSKNKDFFCGLSGWDIQELLIQILEKRKIAQENIITPSQSNWSSNELSKSALDALQAKFWWLGADKHKR